MRREGGEGGRSRGGKEGRGGEVRRVRRGGEKGRRGGGKEQLCVS